MTELESDAPVRHQRTTACWTSAAFRHPADGCGRQKRTGMHRRRRDDPAALEDKSTTPFPVYRLTDERALEVNENTMVPALVP